MGSEGDLKTGLGREFHSLKALLDNYAEREWGGRGQRAGVGWWGMRRSER